VQRRCLSIACCWRDRNRQKTKSDCSDFVDFAGKTASRFGPSSRVLSHGNDVDVQSLRIRATASLGSQLPVKVAFRRSGLGQQYSDPKHPGPLAGHAWTGGWSQCSAVREWRRLWTSTSLPCDSTREDAQNVSAVFGPAEIHKVLSQSDFVVLAVPSRPAARD